PADHGYDPQGVANGVVVNYTEEHLLYLVRWAQRYFGTDPQRTYIKGTSMGGSGAISMGFHHPDVFASIFSAVPVAAYTRRAGADGKSNLLRLDGLCGRPCDETVMSSEGIPVMERMDSERIALEYPGDLPFLVLCNGRTDGSIPWVNNPSFYRALDQGRRGFSSYWNNGAHGMLASVPADIAEFYATQPLELDASYPAFSNFSDNRNPGDGARDDGDITGWMNRGLHWTDLEETENAWSIRIHADGDFLTRPLTVDVTPRRLTCFQIAPNETLRVNGQPRQADANGLLTLRGIQLEVGKPLLLRVSR
ncbi:MAG: alpha/beta hydrolase-fold protein, partial [Verrucomicrobiota bacterium]|nr:alpha/beta hydrolase-fold protein [Verrucomicrobiota bacterium]